MLTLWTENADLAQACASKLALVSAGMKRLLIMMVSGSACKQSQEKKAPKEKTTCNALFASEIRASIEDECS
jgi:hypothetical protein